MIFKFSKLSLVHFFTGEREEIKIYSKLFFIMYFIILYKNKKSRNIYICLK